jgi:hypothetical protein
MIDYFSGLSAFSVAIRVSRRPFSLRIARRFGAGIGADQFVLAERH